MAEYEKRAMTYEEDKYTFSQSPQIASQTGLIGYLRADMDSDGNGFFSNWFDWRKDLKTDEFKKELDEIINSLRKEIFSIIAVRLRYIAAIPRRQG